MYRLVVKFRDLEDLVKKLEGLLEELRGAERGHREEKMHKRAVLLFDETVRKAGSLAIRVARDMGFEVEAYEASSSIGRETVIDGVKIVPVADDLDVLKWARRLNAILITGDKRLAKTAEVYGVKTVYLPPAGVMSREHYVMEVMKKVKKLIEGDSHGA